MYKYTLQTHKDIIHLTTEKKQVNKYCVEDLIAGMEGSMKCLAKLVLVMILVMGIMVFAGAVPPSCCPEIVEWQLH